jgi:hypothetical protein
MVLPSPVSLRNFLGEGLEEVSYGFADGFEVKVGSGRFVVEFFDEGVDAEERSEEARMEGAGDEFVGGLGGGFGGEREGGLEVGAEEVARGGEDDLEILGGTFGEAVGLGHAETAHEDGAVIEKHFEVAAAEGGEFFGGGAGIVSGRFEVRDEEAADEVDYGEVEIFLIFEVSVEGALGCFGAGGDEVHGSALEAGVEEDILGDPEDVIAELFATSSHESILSCAEVNGTV